MKLIYVFTILTRIILCVIDFNLYTCVVMVQGAVMEPFLGFIEAPSLDIMDCKSIVSFAFYWIVVTICTSYRQHLYFYAAVSVLVFGYFVSSYFYP